MNLKEDINSDFKNAFKSGDALVKSVLIMLRSAIKNKELDNKGVELFDEQIIDLVSSEIKKRKDSAKQYRDGGREDLAKSEEDEVVVLQKYMPEQLTKEELEKLVKDAISESKADGMQDLGKVMSLLKDKVRGKADGGEVAKLVKEKLS
jgi:uncharacterized protein YqeY